MKLYEYCVIHTPLPTKDQAERGEEPKSELVVDVTRVLASDEREAGMHAARAIPSQFVDRLSQLDIAVRPF